VKNEIAGLDTIDRTLLRLLQEDGRRTTLELAERVGLSPTGTSQRVKRLFREGYVKRFSDAVAKAPEVLECHMVIGGFDYLVKARIADMSLFQDFLERVILPLPGVRETHTYASVGDVKPDALLPI